MPRAILVVILLSFAVPAHGWGKDGHQIVALIAYEHLTPAARSGVEELLGGSARESLERWAPYADKLRSLPGYGRAGDLHYVNFPPGDCHFNAARDCPNGHCVVAAILNYSESLRTSRDRATRVLALQMLLHLVGDAHQPLHAGSATDKGGNLIQIRYGGHGTNLHQFWDSGLLLTAHQTPAVYAAQIRNDGLATADTRWSPSAPAHWSEESCAIVARGIYPTSRTIDADYVRRERPVAEARLHLAGMRLANLLNTLLR